jgi:hypothetical protein
MTAVYNRSLRGDQRCPASWSGRSSRRIARAGLHSCKTELRHQLRSHGQRDLLGLLANLEQQGFIESETHYRLTPKGAARVPAGDRPGPRSISSIPWRTHSNRVKGAYAHPIDGVSDAAERPLTARRTGNKRTPSLRPTRTKRPATTDAQLRTHTADGRLVHLHRRSLTEHHERGPAVAS